MDLSADLLREVNWRLLELDERRMSDIRPATRFLTNTPLEQWKHVISELGEASIGLIDFVENKNQEALAKVAEEIIDLQMSCETMLAVLGYNEAQRRSLRRQVIEKNRKRGYYSVE